MNQPSQFQAQYPLSVGRKIFKKIVSKFTFWFVWSVIIIFVSVYFRFFQTPVYWQVIHPIFFGLCVFLFVVLLSFILYWTYIVAYIKRYYYDCGDQFITIKKGVFAPTEIHVQYQKIQDVYIDQDIIDRIMGLYDVHIASATVTSGIEAHIDGVNFDVSEGLKDLILAKIHNASNSSPAPQNPTPQPQTNPVQFSQKISSETYPISGKWMWSTIKNPLEYLTKNPNTTRNWPIRTPPTIFYILP